MIRFAGRKEEAVGLDIGSYSIKIISMARESGENTLTAYNIKKIPSGTTELDLERLVKEAFDEIDLHPETVNLSISGPDVLVRFIDLPKMTREQLEGALSFEAEKYIPFNINEVVLDFLILGDAPEAGQMRVLLAAARRQPIEERVSMAERLGMAVNIMDIGPFAMFNAFTGSNPPAEDECNAFLDIGHSRTDVLISTGGLPHFMRQIQIAGKDVTHAICRNLSVSPEKGEEYKMGIGQADREAVAQATEQVLDGLIKETQLSFNYFDNRYNKAVSGIYCSGGMTYQEGVIDYLSKGLGIRVKKWNPAEGIKISENLSKEDIDSVASQLAVGIGLALRG